MSTDVPATTEHSLLSDVTHLITDAKQRAATALNAELPLLYWQACERASKTVLQAGTCQPPRRTDFADSVCNKLGGTQVKAEVA